MRGVYPDEFNEDAAYRIGRAFVQYLGVETVAVGRDMRLSSPALARAVIRGITEQGADAIDLGMTTTDELYFAVGKYGYPAGVMITASHNPAQYNGIKMCRAEAVAISSETGGDAIRDSALGGQFAYARAPGPGHPARRDGRLSSSNASPSSMSPRSSPLQDRRGRRQRHGGHDHAARLPAAALRARPALLRARRQLPQPPGQPHRAGEHRGAARVSSPEQHCDMGVAFDGDADRMFLVDEKGNLLGGDMVTALVAQSLLRKHPGATILYNLICSRSVPEVIERNGGRAVRTRVGHSFIKAQMREENAIFGGEHSGHFYFRDNWYADSGLIAFLIVLELISESGKTVSELVEPIDTALPQRRDQQRGRRPAGARSRPSRRTTPPRARRSTTSTASRLVPDVVGQRPPVQHRAAAAAERGGGHARRDGAPARRGVGADSQ